MKLIFQMSIKLWKKIMKKNYLYIVDLHKLLIKLIYIGWFVDNRDQLFLLIPKLLIIIKNW